MTVLSKLNFQARTAKKTIAHQAHWSERMAGFELGNYFFDVDAQAVAEGTTRQRVREPFSASTSHNLHRLAATPKARHLLLLSALGILIQKGYSVNDLAIFTPCYKDSVAKENALFPVRIQLDSGQSFQNFLSQLATDFKKDISHCDLPLHRMLQLEESAIDNLSIVGLQVEEIHRMDAFDKMDADILFSINTEQDQARLDIHYNSQKFEQDFIQRLATIYLELLDKLMQNSREKMGKIELISAREKNEILRTFNDTKTDFPSNLTIIDQFLQQVNATPDAIALQFDNRQLTYRELDERSNQVAHSIRQTVGEGERQRAIGVYMDRSIEMMIAVFGILKAGCIYLPLSKSHPQDRTRFTLENSEAALVFAQQEDIEELPNGFSCQSIDPSSDHSKEPINESAPEGIAYIIYTSGSTGTPKGVLIQHRSLVNRIHWMQKAYQIGAEDVILQKTPTVFDVSVWELFWWSICGARLVLAPPNAEKDPRQICELIDRAGITTLHFVPSMLQAMVWYATDNPGRHQLSSIRHLVTSGEALKNEEADLFLKLCPQAGLHNLYGPTEATIDVSYYEVALGRTHRNIPIGKPIDNTSLLIFNKEQQLQPIGFPGELYIGGVNLSVGYLKREELNKEKFVSSPLDANERMYRSGDLARWLPDGNIEFLGRIDNQVKIRGNRIELGEIETALNECEGIKTAIVLPKESNGLLQLVGYLLKEGEVTEEELVQQLEQRMPAYMIPSYFIEIDEIPLTVNGKANRKALLAMERSAGKKFIACEGVEENRLANIWKEVLGIEQIGAKDSFFQIGGDSILAIRLIARINRDFETQINVNDLYEHDCIRSLANVVAENGKREQDAAWQEAKEELLHFNKTQLAKRADDNILAVYPMSDIAKAMCYAQLNRPEDCLYIEQMVQPVTFKNFQADKLIRALALLVEKHETFRTGFDLSEFAHIIYRKVDVSVPLIDLSGLDKKTQQQEIQSHLEEGRRKGFDLLNGPLWRFRLYRLSDSYFELVVEQHHAIFDGWSFASFYTELNNLYIELCKREIDRLDILKSSYADAILQELYNKRNEAARDFWKQELSNCQRLRIPSETDEQSFSSIRKSYPDALSNQLNQAAERHQTSLKTILQAAYIYALSALSGQRDVLTGLVTFSRPLKEDGDKILGCFLNTTPFRIVIPEQITWAAYIDLVIRKHQQIRKYESLSLFEISQIVGRHGREENPFFDTYFNYIHWHITKEMEEVEQSEDVVEEHDVFLRGNTFFDASYEWRNDRVYCLSEYMSPYFSEAIFQKYEQAFLHAIFCLAETPALEMDGIEPESISLEADVLQSDEKSIHQGPFVRANTPTEKLLTSIWAKILRMEADEISTNQSFFDLGGNSLTAMSMIQTILKYFNITLSMRQLFSANTIEEIARFIDGELWLKQQPQTANSSDSEQFIL